MAIFNSYVKLPEGNTCIGWSLPHRKPYPNHGRGSSLPAVINVGIAAARAAAVLFMSPPLLGTKTGDAATPRNHVWPTTHRIHGAGIYANIWGILMVNVTIYIAYMDPMGYEKCINHSGSGTFGFSDVVQKNIRTYSLSNSQMVDLRPMTPRWCLPTWLHPTPIHLASMVLPWPSVDLKKYGMNCVDLKKSLGLPFFEELNNIKYQSSRVNWGFFV